ncbi:MULTISPECIES: hypothetical protein [unclassified Clostridium]|uniref:hypothetical protein n=1 Tax=unclassified Clostridium TaxID=2614128 RepID=UPI001A9B6E22|nr:MULTISPECIES: hypothetical protein [unclassified Clostridium]
MFQAVLRVLVIFGVSTGVHKKSSENGHTARNHPKRPKKATPYENPQNRPVEKKSGDIKNNPLTLKL